jgi:hypothetical protein
MPGKSNRSKYVGIRVPLNIYAHVADMAARDKVSLSAWIVRAMKNAAIEENALQKPETRVQVTIRAYRALCKVYHPDVSYDPQATKNADHRRCVR